MWAASFVPGNPLVRAATFVLHFYSVGYERNGELKSRPWRYNLVAGPYGRPRTCRSGDWQLQCCQASVAADPFAGFACLLDGFYMGGRGVVFSALSRTPFGFAGEFKDIQMRFLRRDLTFGLQRGGGECGKGHRKLKKRFVSVPTVEHSGIGAVSLVDSMGVQNLVCLFGVSA